MSCARGPRMTLRRLTALTFLFAAATTVSACSPVQEGF